MKRTLIALPILSLCLVAPSTTLAAKIKKKYVKVQYFQNMFGHIHQNPSKYSTSLSTLSCGHPVKIYKKVYRNGGTQMFFNDNWNLVKVGPYEGYIHKDALSNKKQNCFQDRYPKFFEAMNLEISDMYYWGRLYDQYVTGESTRPGHAKK